MFEQRGFETGQQDGRNDAFAKRRYHPKLNLRKAIISVRYQEAYLRAYARAYFDTQREMIQQETRDRRQFQARAFQLKTSKHALFDDHDRENLNR
ncbi:MAG: hypothetical protein AAFQ24_13055 [Pseudomonadota bacterium]